ncbi:alpha/beta fold hydrolase [Hydrogenophaga palleronii]|uniref:alpha/beta fold hydrolase n=1 Tax=Hydrogenophaga palleronii TaxID=65655 RepID=UPI000823FA17|nr:alpha/beta fold hydrolase [Hydrogenophaga palleronii]
MSTAAKMRAWMPQPASVQAVEEQGERIDVPHDGGFVCWRRFGEGSPLVLLHGGHGSWMHWLRNIPALAERHTVWVPDLPGFGDSSDVPDDGTPHGPLQRLMDALDETLSTVLGDLPEVDVAAFSFGALVTAHLHRRGRLMRRIALLGPAAHSGPRGPEVSIPPWRHTDTAATREDALRRNLLAFMFHRSASADAAALYAQEYSSLRCRLRVVREVSRASRLGELLHDFETPMLCAWGAQDCTAIAAEVGPMLCDNSPQRTWRVLDGAAHWVQHERADATNALLLSWFAANVEQVV